jgi:type VI protein secretion system component Hcp
MYGEMRAERRLSAWGTVLLVAALVTAWMVLVDRSEAAPAPATGGAAEVVAAALQSEYDGGGIYAKYEGIDGESPDVDHHDWIELARFAWGAHQTTVAQADPRRARTAADPDGFVLAFAYEKASPKLEEKVFKGDVIPRLEVEVTAYTGEDRTTYLRYDFTNVRVTDFTVEATAGYGRPEMVFANTFEEVKVTYSEFDPMTGEWKGNIEYSWKVE